MSHIIGGWRDKHRFLCNSTQFMQFNAIKDGLLLAPFWSRRRFSVGGKLTTKKKCARVTGVFTISSIFSVVPCAKAVAKPPGEGRGDQ
jgi:hypothetical protein